MSAWLKLGPNWVLDVFERFSAGQLNHMGKELVKLEEEKHRSLVLAMLEPALAEVCFYHGLEYYAERLLDSMRGVARRQDVTHGLRWSTI